MKIIYTLLLMFTIISNPLVSQEEDPKKEKTEEKAEETEDKKTDEDENFELEFDKTLGLDFGLSDRKSIEIVYGLANSYRNQELTENALLDIKFGTVETEKLFKKDVESGVFEYEYSTLYLKNFNWDLGSEMNMDTIQFKAWQIGFGEQEGFGYDISDNFSIILFNGNGTGLSWITETNIPFDGTPLSRYGKYTRYTEFMEAGVKLGITEYFTLNASLERNAIFSRYMIWHNMLSAGLVSIVQEVAEGFTDDIIESAPVAVPILNFIIQNGISYGFYELRKNDMNWPIKSSPALITDVYKIGFNVNF